MAFNLGDVFVTFKAKTDELNKGIDKVKQKVDSVNNNVNKFDFKGFSAKASSAFGSVASSIQGAITKLAIFAASSSFGLGTFVKSAADLQQTSKSFEVLTGNVEVANGLFAKLAQYANTTPFEFPDIAKAGQTLLGFGIESDKVFGHIQMLGDIAAATGADFGSLALVFGQVNATGRLMGQDALQLINNKVPITTILAKKLGISVQDVKKKMEAGAISTQMFNEALVGVTKEGGFAFKGTDILAQSFNGRMSTLKDTVLEFGRSLLGVKVDPKLGLVIEEGGIFDRLSKTIPKITKSLGDMAPKIKRGFDFIVRNGETIKQILIAVGSAFVAAKLAALGFAAVAAYNPYVVIAGAIIALIGVLVYLQQRFNWIGQAIQFLKPYWDSLVKIVQEFVIPSMRALAGAIVKDLWPALQNIIGAVVRLWNALNPGLMTALKFIAAFIGAVWVAQIWLMINAFRLTVKAVSAVINILSNLTGWISNLISWIGNIPGAFMRAWHAAGDWLGKIPGLAKDVIGEVVGWFEGMPGRIGGAVSTIGDKILSPFKWAFNEIAKFWNNTVGKLSFEAPSWVPGLGGKGWSMPKLPQLAMGTGNWRGGMVRMNEFGPETAVLPKGTRVVTADQTRRGEKQGGNTYIIDMKGVMARSDSELADIMYDGIRALDRRLAGTGKPQILGGQA